MTSIQSTGNDAAGGREPPTHYILGGGRVGLAVARRLDDDGVPVRVVNEFVDPSTVSGVRGDPTDVRALQEAGVADATTVVVASRSDSRNLLVAQLVRTHFDVPNVVVLANAPDGYEALAATGHVPVSVPIALSDALFDHL